MSFFDRLKNLFNPSASWNWRTGTKGGHIFDGSKFSGKNLYPSAWGFDADALRDSSRAAFWDSTQARSIISRLTDLTIGSGLTLESTPIWGLIGGENIEESEKHQISRDIETRFDLWANSHDADSTEARNFYELQAHEYLNRLRDGESFFIIRYSGNASRISTVNLQMIPPEQITTPRDRGPVDPKKIIDGIELDTNGKPIAIFVQDSEYENRWTRVPFFGPSGRRFVIHTKNSDLPGALRGTPILAPIVHELKKITDYTVAEIEAAVLNAIMAVWIKPSAESRASQVFAGIQKRNGQTPVAIEEQGVASFDKPGLIIQNLRAGEEIQSFNTNRPNVNFGTFVQQIEKSLAASLSIPISVLSLQSTASYSAIRAELLLFWHKIEIERKKTESQLLDVVYRAWFTEEVATGRIVANGFGIGSPVVDAAWLKSSWNGSKQPAIDPAKEANADDIRIAQGSTTRERVAKEYNGSDFMENAMRLKIENQAIGINNVDLLEENDQNEEA